MNKLKNWWKLGNIKQVLGNHFELLIEMKSRKFQFLSESVNVELYNRDLMVQIVNFSHLLSKVSSSPVTHSETGLLTFQWKFATFEVNRFRSEEFNPQWHWMNILLYRMQDNCLNYLKLGAPVAIGVNIIWYHSFFLFFRSHGFQMSFILQMKTMISK